MGLLDLFRRDRPASELPPPPLIVAVDDACPQTPGPAGWAWVNEAGAWAAGALSGVSRAESELTALVEAVEAHARVPHVQLRVASSYAHSTYTQWMDEHAARGWVGKNGRPVKNRPLIERALTARDARRTAGLPDVDVFRIPGREGHRASLWAYTVACRALRHAKLGSERTWSPGDGDFTVDMGRDPRNSDKAVA